MRIFKLIWLETRFLRRTIILIGLILTAFVAALLSVVSVLLDMPEGMYAGLDEYYEHFKISVRDIDLDYINELGGTPAYGSVYGITRYAVLTGTYERSLRTHPSATNSRDLSNANLLSRNSTGYVIFPEVKNELEESFCEALLSNSRFPENPGEIVIGRSMANLIGVTQIGQTITFSADVDCEASSWDLSEVTPETYTVVGFLDTTKISNKLTRTPNHYLTPSADFYMIPAEGNNPLSSICFALSDARTQNAVHTRLEREGFDIASRTPARALENISLAQAFFGAISGVLGAMVLFILYSLIAIFYRQRKAQICRLKLLGASTGTIAGVYCCIAIALSLIAVMFGAAFSMLFNIYFMNLCASLFSTFSNNFVSHFRPAISLIVFAALAVFTLLLFFRFNRKVKNATIAQEVRHE